MSLLEVVQEHVHGLTRWLSVQCRLELELPAIDGGQALAFETTLAYKIEQSEAIRRQSLHSLAILVCKEEQGWRKVLQGEPADLSADASRLFEIVVLQGLSQLIDPAAVATAGEGVGSPGLVARSRPLDPLD